jgi:amino acid adenylation domain-containing protein
MSGRLLQHYLSATAARFPQRTAVRAGDQAITYGDLREKSDGLARQLLSLGLKRQEPVGLFLDKSIEAIAAMFAVLKAGGAYIPLDSRYSPMSRILGIMKAGEIRFLIGDCARIRGMEQAMYRDPDSRLPGITAVLTDTLLAEYRLVSPDPQEGGLIRGNPYCPGLPEPLQPGETTAETDLAYVLYTSGSTGAPKGVMLSHLNARTFIDWALATFRPTEDDSFSGIAPLHFDLSVFDIYVSTACGGTLHLPPDGAAPNPRALLAWLKASGVTFVYSVPSVWIALMNYAGLRRGDLPSLTRILFAGEVFPPKQLKALMGLVPQAAFYNLYGPTETNVCTFYRVPDAEGVTDKNLPIGKSCAGTETVALKDNGEEAAANETGELMVCGPIVTGGYYKNRGLTAAAFIPSPLPRHRGALLYRTGDLVRLAPGGDYEYLGRRDLMVKLAGFRIELPEVERALLGHGSICEAVVVPVFDGDGLKAAFLAAFITLKDGPGTGVVEVKEFLAGILPRYMVPEKIVILQEMPRNGNGKADRRQLAELAGIGGAHGNR